MYVWGTEMTGWFESRNLFRSPAFFLSVRKGILLTTEVGCMICTWPPVCFVLTCWLDSANLRLNSISYLFLLFRAKIFYSCVSLTFFFSFEVAGFEYLWLFYSCLDWFSLKVAERCDAPWFFKFSMFCIDWIYEIDGLFNDGKRLLLCSSRSGDFDPFILTALPLPLDP